MTSLTMRPMRTLLLMIALAGCGSNSSPAIDAPPPPPIDSPAPPALALDCPTYCTEIMANCTGTNTQYADLAHCTGSCAAFVSAGSKTTDTAGDTLGCRIYHGSAPSMTMPALHCPHAGPGGDHIDLAAGTNPAFCSGATAAPDNLCQNFCALTIKTCGTAAAPLTIGGIAIPPPYADMNTCVTACAGFSTTLPYATTSKGNSLACRLNHWTNAASNAAITPPTATSGGAVKLHCGHIVAVPAAGDPCDGTASN